MKKIVCFLAVLGIVIAGVLFIVNLTAPLEARPWSGAGTAIPDWMCGSGWRCQSGEPVTCNCDPGWCCR
jgi:uncharacterized protein YceK